MPIYPPQGGGGASGPAPVMDAFDDAADLRNKASGDLNAGDLVYVSGIGFFSWSTTSTATDDGTTVIKPNDVAP